MTRIVRPPGKGAPVIDREVLFGNPRIAGGQLSPDGRWLSFVQPLDRVLNVWVKRLEEPFESARPLTDDRKRPAQALKSKHPRNSARAFCSACGSGSTTFVFSPLKSIQDELGALTATR